MKKKVKTVFLGSPEYVYPVLEALLKSHELVGIVTQEPKPAGRNPEPEPSSVEKWAKTHGIEVYYSPEKLPKADVAVVASYGKIINIKTLKHFKNNTINIHPSLLPKYRGASPIQATILRGDKQTGISFIRMDEELDHGPVLHTILEPVHDEDTTESLRKRLFELSGKEIPDLVTDLVSGKVKEKEQDHKKATFTKTIKKEDSYIDPKEFHLLLKGKTVKETVSCNFLKGEAFSVTPEFLERFVRAMHPWPLVWTYVHIKQGKRYIKKRFVIHKGSVIDSAFVPQEVQIEGKNPVFWKQFLEGYKGAKFS